MNQKLTDSDIDRIVDLLRQAIKKGEEQQNLIDACNGRRPFAVILNDLTEFANISEDAIISFRDFLKYEINPDLITFIPTSKAKE